MRFNPDDFGVEEIHEVAANALVVVLLPESEDEPHRYLRLTAWRQHPDGQYSAHYEERVRATIDSVSREFWVTREPALPWAMHDNVEGCLRSAMSIGLSDLRRSAA